MRQKAQISEDSTIFTTGTISQYPCKISCIAKWGEQDKTIEFQRVILKEDARTKFGGSNPMQPTVIAWEEAISKADHSDIEVVLPLVLYLSTARLWKDGNKKATKRGYSAGRMPITIVWMRSMDWILHFDIWIH